MSKEELQPDGPTQPPTSVSGEDGDAEGTAAAVADPEVPGVSGDGSTAENGTKKSGSTIQELGEFDSSAQDATPAAVVPHADEPAELQDPPRGIRNRIAATLTSDNPLGAGAEFLASPFSWLREAAVPILALVALATILITFRQVLLPFILACALVYLMEPVVRLLSAREGASLRLPRWAAVILVYLTFIGTLSVSLVFVVPTFVAEIVRFAEEVPELVQQFRSEQLPGLNQRVQATLKSYLPVGAESEVDRTAAARDAIVRSREGAARFSVALGNAQAAVGHASTTSVHWIVEGDGAEAVGSFSVREPEGPAPRLALDDALGTTGWKYANSSASTLLLTPDRAGGMAVQLNDVALEVQEVDEKTWVVRRHSRTDEIPVRQPTVDIDDLFNLERRMDQLLEELVSTSNARLASIIEFAQKLVVGIVGAFVGFILTLMVAAFISMDLPRVMSFQRGLVPERMRAGYDVLMRQLDTGLAGVVRGQLLICLVNGTLTYVGLAVMGVKFSVLLAVVAGILSLIPVFGTVLSTVPIVLIALTDGLVVGLAALGWILFIHALEANLLNPKIIGSSAHIHPVIVIFALLAGESAYGLVGALLAVPTASILLTLFNFVRTKAWRSVQPTRAQTQT